MTISEQITQAIHESPQIVADSEMSLFEDINWRREKLISLSKNRDKWTEVAKVNGVDAPNQQLWSVSFDVSTEYFVISSTDNTDISYYAKIKPVNAAHIKPVKKQSLVWQKPTFRGALSIFLDIYLPKYKYMSSDQFQTTGGKRFWQSLIAEVLKVRGSVYFINTGSVNKTLKINTYSDLDTYYSEIWGSTSKFKHRLLVVSQNKIDRFEQNLP